MSSESWRHCGILPGGIDETDGHAAYDRLPPNGTRVFDLLVRDFKVEHPGGWSGVVDLGVMFERYSNRAIIKEVGDLRGFGGLDILAGRNRRLPEQLRRIGTSVERSTIYELLDFSTTDPT